MPEAFTAIREAAVHVLNERHFDIQIIGGVAFHQGNIAEMKTDEGKTSVGTPPSYLNTFSGNGVHIATINGYLAKYQFEQMGRTHHLLGLEVGVILISISPAERRIAYQADTTYDTNNKSDFDHLRDDMALNNEDLMQRGHHFAVADEVDSILTDEARTLLIIPRPAQDTHEWYLIFARMVHSMKRDQHYEVDEKKRTVAISSAGIEVVKDQPGTDNLCESANTPLINHLSNAIKARELFKRSKDYVALGDEILVIDEHIGRTLARRHYDEGLYQTLRAEEKVKIRDGYQTFTTVTLQNYPCMYGKLAGMAGAAKTEESEFQRIYDLGVIPIPTNMSMIRIDQHDRIYRTEEARYKAIIEDVVLRHEDGQPVLIGIASVAKSELLFGMLEKEDTPHKVLNAKQYEREAAVVAQASHKGAVTVSTSMVGRDVDIMLGGNPEFLADLQLRKQGLSPVETPERHEAQRPDTLEAPGKQMEAEHDEVVETSGPYVISSECHESHRVDNQLRGCPGRQGDPGESHFYLSLSDDLMRPSCPKVLECALIAPKVPNDVPVDSKSVSNTIESMQKQAEGQNSEMRKDALKRDDVMNRQRHVIYRNRRRVLDGADLSEQLCDRAAEVIAAVVRQHAVDIPEDWDLEMFFNELKTPYPVGLDQEEIGGEIPAQEKLVGMFSDDVCRAYDEREETLGSETMRELERQVLFPVVDRSQWEHLYEMDYLREGVRFHVMARRDSLIEYQREGGDMFIAVWEASSKQIIGMLFNPQADQPEPASAGIVIDAEGKPEDVLAEAAAVPEGGAKPRHAEPLAKGLGGKREEDLTYSVPDESGETITGHDDGAEKPVKKTATDNSGDGNRATWRKKARRRRRIPGTCHEHHGRRIG